MSETTPYRKEVQIGYFLPILKDLERKIRMITI